MNYCLHGLIVSVIYNEDQKRSFYDVVILETKEIYHGSSKEIPVVYGLYEITLSTYGEKVYANLGKKIKQVDL